MIKGVNKNIIEVANTGNRYFDKAILFVKPRYNTETTHKLEDEARQYLKSVGIPSNIKKGARQKLYKTKKLRKLLTFIAVGVVALIIGLVYLKYS
ncbi:MAG: hypothetical protein IJF54_05665 [Clostridia bacterium]|nr:hypothetical protein [Clostridia bacterium]